MLIKKLTQRHPSELYHATMLTIHKQLQRLEETTPTACPGGLFHIPTLVN